MMYILGLLISALALYIIIKAIIAVKEAFVEALFIVMPLLITTFTSLIVYLYGTIFIIGG